MDDESITRTFIGEEYGWDRVSEVNWPMLRHNLQCKKDVVNNPDQFPKADFEALHKSIEEHQIFLMTHGIGR